MLIRSKTSDDLLIKGHAIDHPGPHGRPDTHEHLVGARDVEAQLGLAFQQLPRLVLLVLPFDPELDPVVPVVVVSVPDTPAAQLEFTLVDLGYEAHVGPEAFSDVLVAREHRPVPGLVAVVDEESLTTERVTRLAEFLGSPLLSEQGKVPLSLLVEQATIREVGQEMTDGGPLGPVALHSSLHASLSSTFQDLDLLDQKALEELEQIDPLRKQTVAWYRASRNRLKGYYTREQLAHRVMSDVCQVGQAPHHAQYVQRRRVGPHPHARIALFEPAKCRSRDLQTVRHHLRLDTPA